MKVIRGLKNLKDKIKTSVLTIGVFDGVHIGHKKIIKKVVARAKTLKAKSVILTFDPHPSKVLKSKAKSLSLVSLKHRIKLIEELGVDYLVIIKFTKSISELSPERFIRNILVNRLSLKEMYVGENFYLGKGGKAGVKVLKELAETLGFKIRIVKPIKTNGDVISSTLIRRLIVDGDTVKASRFLGRPVSVLGTVIRGRRRGRILGYPTANINPHHEAIPPSGVYAVKAHFRNKLLRGVLNIGTRPTFYKRTNLREPTIEVHIFDFNKRIYGEDLEIIFVKKLRDEQTFKDKDNLILQIKRDEQRARNHLQNSISVLI